MSEQESVPAGVVSKPQLIKRVLIIDDAFDAIEVDDYREEVAAFADAVAASEHEESLLSELAKQGALPSRTGQGGPEQLTPAVIRSVSSTSLTALYDATLPKELGSLLDEHVFRALREKRAEVTRILEALKARGVEVETLGSTERLPSEAPDLVLLDYYLGITDDDTARKQAVERMAQFASTYAAANPFVVLMSSRRLDAATREKFRSESGWLAGLFDFVPKEDIARADALKKRVTLWEMALPNRRYILGFVRAVEESMSALGGKFMQRVRSLALEDYALLQRLELSADGQPLGEYMLWLFGSLLPHLAFDDSALVRAARQDLDRVRFDHLLPTHWQPSRAVAECYRLAVSSAALDPIAAHPLHTGTAAGLPYLKTGDLLSDGTSSYLWMVANAACDIAFAPGTTRDDPERYIALVRGELVELTPETTQRMPEHQVCTPLFESKGKPYRIEWSVTKPHYVRHGEFERWRAELKLERSGRLRVAYALEVQQAFANNLVRIGMPVPPPASFDADVEFFMKGKSDLAESASATVIAGATVFVLRKNRSFQLKMEAIEGVMSALSAARDALRVSLDMAKNPEHRAKVQSRINSIDVAINDASMWRNLAGAGFEVPAGQAGVSIIQDLISAFFNRTFDASAKYQGGSVLSLNIRASADAP